MRDLLAFNPKGFDTAAEQFVATYKHAKPITSRRVANDMRLLGSAVGDLHPLLERAAGLLEGSAHRGIPLSRALTRSEQVAREELAEGLRTTAQRAVFRASEVIAGLERCGGPSAPTEELNSLRRLLEPLAENRFRPLAQIDAGPPRTALKKR